MGFFDKVVKAVNIINKASEQLENIMESQQNAANKPTAQTTAAKPAAQSRPAAGTQPATTTKPAASPAAPATVKPVTICTPAPGSNSDIMLLPGSHTVEYEEFSGDNKYAVSFKLNDAFKEARSHAAEVTMLNTYAPDSEYGEEGSYPYIAIQMDDDVYCPVEEFKTSGSFKGAIELTPLDGKFYFKAKKEYYGYMMYFYGMDRCDNGWENNGLCVVYPKSYVGTQSEVNLMKALDEAAESYSERKIQ